MGYPQRIPIPFIGKISGIVPVGPKDLPLADRFVNIKNYNDSNNFGAFFGGHVGGLSTTILETMPYTKNLCYTVALFLRTASSPTPGAPNARGTPYHHPTIPPICAISVSVVIFKLDGLSLQFGVAFFSTPKDPRLLGDNCFFSL